MPRFMIMSDLISMKSKPNNTDMTGTCIDTCFKRYLEWFNNTKEFEFQ